MAEWQAGAARVARRAFRKGSLAIRARDELGSWCDDAAFAVAYGTRGKPGISPAQLAMVTVLQFTENLTDRQAADAVRARLDWKYCLGLALEDEGFDFSVLSEYRSRLVAGGMDRALLDLLLDRLKALGLVRPGGRQRTDSTHVLAAIRGMNRLELAGETVRAALEALAAAAPDWLAAVIDDSWQRVYGQRIDTLRLPASQAARTKLAEQYGRDGYRLLEAVRALGAPGWLGELPALTALRAIWVQQYYRTGEHAEKVIWREPGKEGIPPGRLKLVSPYDLDARYCEKRGKGAGRITRSTSARPAASRNPAGPRVPEPDHQRGHITEASVPDALMTEAAPRPAAGHRPGARRARRGCRLHLRRPAAQRACPRHHPARPADGRSSGSRARPRLHQRRVHHRLGPPAGDLPPGRHQQPMEPVHPARRPQDRDRVPGRRLPGLPRQAPVHSRLHSLRQAAIPAYPRGPRSHPAGSLCGRPPASGNTASMIQEEHHPAGHPRHRHPRTPPTSA